MSAPFILEQHAERLECFIYHSSIPAEVLEQMDKVRQEYLNFASYLIKLLPESRSKSIALTHLEESSTQAIQSLALQGEPQCQMY